MAKGNRVPPKSLMIQSRGVGRLSPDLATMAAEFFWEVDIKRKKLTLSHGAENATGVGTLRVWRAGNQADSGLIALKSVLRSMKLDPEVLQGNVYNVSVKGNRLEIRF